MNPLENVIRSLFIELWLNYMTLSFTVNHFYSLIHGLKDELTCHSLIVVDVLIHEI